MPGCCVKVAGCCWLSHWLLSFPSDVLFLDSLTIVWRWKGEKAHIAAHVANWCVLRSFWCPLFTSFVLQIDFTLLSGTSLGFQQCQERSLSSQWFIYGLVLPAVSFQSDHFGLLVWLSQLHVLNHVHPRMYEMTVCSYEEWCWYVQMSC